jgi:orotidine-5'-phosphate decarboxylase
MKRSELIEQIRGKRSFLCIGLDTDLKKIPRHLLSFPDPVFEFNRQIIDATQHLCVAYKINTAFYESRGLEGWKSLIATFDYLPKTCFSIADAKRGDIGNTSEMYARAFFDRPAAGMSFDSITVAPYMGEDSITPFLTYPDKWVILLAHTSNPGSMDFQGLALESGAPLFMEVVRKSMNWASHDRLMFVVGATHGQAFSRIREAAPDHFLLVPGVGAQGGSLEEVCRYGMNQDCGLLVNASRSIIYASGGTDFAERAAEEAASVQAEMALQLDRINFI